MSLVEQRQITIFCKEIHEKITLCKEVAQNKCILVSI